MFSLAVPRPESIELAFIVPPGSPARTVEAWDRLRVEISDAIGGDMPNRWLTVEFTVDPEWAE